MMKTLRKRFGLRGILPSKLENRLLYRMLLAVAAGIVAWWFDAPQWVQVICIVAAAYFIGAKESKDFWQDSEVVVLWSAEVKSHKPIDVAHRALRYS